MSLSTALVDSTAPTLVNETTTGWNPACHITYNRESWVKLVQPPSEYAMDEAKLLCQESATTWIAWVPGYGEVTLEETAFYC